MPSVTAMIWNIERFGIETGNQRSGLQLDFIDYLIRATSTSILVIEEFRSAAIQNLPYLKEYLEFRPPRRTWAYDWVAGALTNIPADAAGGVAVATSADTGFVGPAYDEGYAVFWVADRHSSALVPVAGTTSQAASQPCGVEAPAPHFLELVTHGPRLIFPRQSTVPPPPPVGGATFRIIQDATAAPALRNYAFGFPGPNVDSYQHPSTLTMTTRSGADPADPNLDILSLQNVRLPVQIKIATAAGWVPMIVHHAPNGTYSSKYTAAVCGLLPQVTNGNPVIVAGDFNLSHGNERTIGFASFLHFGLQPQSLTGGHYDRTMVHPTTGPAGHKSLLPLNGDPLTSARDQVFSRGVAISAEGPTGVLPVLNDLSSQGSDLALSVVNSTDAKSIMSELLRDNGAGLIDALGVSPIDPNRGAIVTSLRKNFPRSDQRRTLDHFESPVTAAIFYKLLISDHLPLVITIAVA